MAKVNFGARNPLRTQQIIEWCRAGLTLQQVGDRFNISRERVRQIVAANDVLADERGRAIRRKAREQNISDARRLKRDAWAMSIYGCDYATLIDLNGGSKTRGRDSFAMRYFQQKRNAMFRGIEFRLTFPQWMRVWNESKKLNERGRGHGKFVMSRFGDAGAYEVGNVFIQSADSNNSEGVKAARARGCYKKAA